MKHPLLSACVLALWPVLTAAGPAGPTRAADPAAFIPPDYVEKARARGDLNADGQDDIALVAVPQGETEMEARRRLLLIAWQTAPGAWERALVTDRAIMGRGEGGVFGDPFQGIAIERGALVLSHYGGSAERWGMVARFRRQSGQWQLIGETTTTEQIHTGEQRIRDTNYSTGVWIETYRPRQGAREQRTSQQLSAAERKQVRTLEQYLSVE